MEIILPSKQHKLQSSVNSWFLNPGDFHFGESNCQIHTVLGSCTAIMLWHPDFRIGGMCDYVLPLRGVASDANCKRLKLNGRYSDEAMTMFERFAQQYGTKLAHLSKRLIPLLVAHMGETGYRRIAFDIETGDVWVKHKPLQNMFS